MSAEDAYLVDLCDAALGEQAVRGAELAWLREGADPSGPPARVDAWYPEARVIILLTAGRDEKRSFALASAAEPYGVAVFELPRGWVERDAAGTPRRLPREAERVVRMLGTEEDREDARVRPAWGGVVVGFNVADGEWPDDEDEEGWDDEDDDDLNDWGADEEADEDAPPASPAFLEATAETLGWRGRSVALALLEAVRLSRRAFAVDRAGAHLSREALEVRLALLYAGGPEGPPATVVPHELEVLLARDRFEVDDALGELRATGQAEAHDTDPELAEPGSGAEHDWALTESGRDAALEWIARVLPLFGGWPPDVPDVDDAAG